MLFCVKFKIYVIILTHSTHIYVNALLFGNEFYFTFVPIYKHQSKANEVFIENFDIFWFKNHPC